MDYRTIKKEARALGCSVGDLIALAPQNDPFYTGRPAELAAAQWFAGNWHRFGYGNGVHLRRIHYQLVSQDPPAQKPDGKPYENTENDWTYLCNASKYARYLELVPAGQFVDRRNPDAIIRANWHEDPVPEYWSEGGGWRGYHQLPDLPALADLPDALPDLPDLHLSGYDGIQQPYHVEVWAEKTTMNDVLLPLCEQYSVNLVTGAGELSITAVIDFLERVQKADRPARILYVSDFDPAGLGMPISVARKVEFYQRKGGFDYLDIRLDPVVLTAEQVEWYNLPRVPVKDSDRRKASFEAAHGKGQVELDALEALHPGELAQILERAILGYHDPDLERRARAEEDQLREALQARRDEITGELQEDLDRVEADYTELRADFAKTRQRFAELVADFQAEIDTHRERLEDITVRGRGVYGTLYDRLTEVDLDIEDYPLPEPDLPPESETLYDSRLDYFQQLARYKEHRNGGGDA